MVTISVVIERMVSMLVVVMVIHSVDVCRRVFITKELTVPVEVVVKVLSTVVVKKLVTCWFTVLVTLMVLVLMRVSVSITGSNTKVE